MIGTNYFIGTNCSIGKKNSLVCSVGSNLLIGTKNVSLEQIIPLEQMEKKYPIETSSRKEKRKREEKN
jgi:hypothetical protein